MKYDCQLAGVSARPPDRVELIDAGSLGYGTGGPTASPSAEAGKLPSPNHCESRDFLLVFTNLSLSKRVEYANKYDIYIDRSGYWARGASR